MIKSLGWPTPPRMKPTTVSSSPITAITLPRFAADSFGPPSAPPPGFPPSFAAAIFSLKKYGTKKWVLQKKNVWAEIFLFTKKNIFKKTSVDWSKNWYFSEKKTSHTYWANFFCGKRLQCSLFFFNSADQPSFGSWNIGSCDSNGGILEKCLTHGPRLSQAVTAVFYRPSIRVKL